MNTKEKQQLLEKITSYVDMVGYCEQLIESHKETINNPKYNPFPNLKRHYYQRININRCIIERVNRRINELTLKLIK
jgi:hypothetical protein